MNVNPESHMPGWQGLTIKEILEKVDLFNISTLVEEEKKSIAGDDTDDVKVCLVLMLIFFIYESQFLDEFD